MYKIFGKRFHAWTTKPKEGPSRRRIPDKKPFVRRLDREVANAPAEKPTPAKPQLVKGRPPVDPSS